MSQYVGPQIKTILHEEPEYAIFLSTKSVMHKNTE